MTGIAKYQICKCIIKIPTTGTWIQTKLGQEKCDKSTEY